MTSLFPPSCMSVPLPAMLVAIVTAPVTPAKAIILGTENVTCAKKRLNIDRGTETKSKP